MYDFAWDHTTLAIICALQFANQPSDLILKRLCRTVQIQEHYNLICYSLCLEIACLGYARMKAAMETPRRRCSLLITNWVLNSLWMHHIQFIGGDRKGCGRERKEDPEWTNTKTGMEFIKRRRLCLMSWLMVLKTTIRGYTTSPYFAKMLTIKTP